MDIKSDITSVLEAENQDWFPEKIEKEIAHRDFLNQQNSTDNFTTTVTEAFRKAMAG